MYEHRDKNYWLYKIKEDNKRINESLLCTQSHERFEVAESIIVRLRNLTQSLQAYIKETYEPKVFKERFHELQEADKYCRRTARFNFLSTFLQDLNIVQHESVYGEYAERLLQKYYHYLLKIKTLFSNEFKITILENLSKYPLDLDHSFLEYYRRIIPYLAKAKLTNDFKGAHQYYVQKKKVVFVDGVLFYEYTLTAANDFTNRFDRFSAFSSIDIFPNYCIKAKMVTFDIPFLGTASPYTFIIGYKTSVRICEIEKLSHIFSIEKTYSKTNGYNSLMTYMQEHSCSLPEILLSDSKTYASIVKGCFSNTNKENLELLLNKVHDFLLKKQPGWKTITYLLYHLNNSVLKKQITSSNNFYDEEGIYGLQLKKGIFPFESYPFSSFLINHQPKLSDITFLFQVNENKGDYLARLVADSSNEKDVLYLPKKDLITEEDESSLLKYNASFCNTPYGSRSIEFDHKSIFLKENEDNTVYILTKILEKVNKENFKNYSSYLNGLILQNKITIDDKAKSEALLRAFDKKSVFAVYGPAGSGKTFFAKLLIDLLPDYKICCIAATNPAVDNMRQKIGSSKAEFMTTTKYLKDGDFEVADLLVIDECSTISSRDMKMILDKSKEPLLLFLGDTYQIHSIKFGNWFSLLPYFLKKDAFVDLANQFRSQSEVLLKVWESVRKLESNIQELLDTNEISHHLDDSIFERNSDDEIVLCLNYDGLYGINNINKVIQSKNKNKTVRWKQYIFKVNDPIILLESLRFEGIFHNNQKGKIIGIEEDIYCLRFKVQIFSMISPKVLASNPAIESYDFIEKTTIVQFSVRKSSEDEYDHDSKSDAIFPFQIAYAISIHKAQGLEYDSVKIVISNEVEEQISHNVFYTAITRTKKLLRIYWSIESETKILQSFRKFNCENDAKELKKKFPKLIQNH